MERAPLADPIGWAIEDLAEELVKLPCPRRAIEVATLRQRINGLTVEPPDRMQ